MEYDLLSRNPLIFILVLNGLGDEAKADLSTDSLFFHILERVNQK